MTNYISLFFVLYIHSFCAVENERKCDQVAIISGGQAPLHLLYIPADGREKDWSDGAE